MAAWPVKMSGSEVKLAPAPLLGANNEDVLEDWLGISADEVAALKKDGAL